VGHVFKNFLEVAFAGHVKPFLSDADIAPGERFLTVIESELNGASLGVLLVTRDNQTSPWLLFEAGALASKTSRGSVAPLLIDVERQHLTSPLNQFQNVVGSSEHEIRKLCERIRVDAGESPPAKAFELLFTDAWPELLAALEEARNYKPTQKSQPEQTIEATLAEILLGVNSLVQRRAAGDLVSQSSWGSSSAVRDNGALKLEVGQRINHVDFGDGTVTALTGEGSKTVAHVRFDVSGPKKLLVKVSPIIVLG